MRLDPFCKHVTDDGFTGRTNDQRFIEWSGRHQASIGTLFQSMVGNDRALFGESFDVFGLFFEKTFGNENWEISVFMPRFLEFFIQNTLHIFPDPITPRLDDHTTANWGDFRQFSCLDDRLVPFGIIFAAGGGDCVLGHFGILGLRDKDRAGPHSRVSPA